MSVHSDGVTTDLHLVCMMRYCICLLVQCPDSILGGREAGSCSGELIFFLSTFGKYLGCRPIVTLLQVICIRLA